MDINRALVILGEEEFEDAVKLKRKYRKLMRLVHPDNGKEAHLKYCYSAQEINAAYTYLIENINNRTQIEEKKKESNKKHWNARINNRAFVKRKIYDDITDVNGNVIGVIEIANDKYYWCIEEGFSLFLKSIYELSKSLLDDIDSRLNRVSRQDYEKYQAELSYLLASQYVDGLEALYQLGYDIENEEDIELFYIPAMIEGESTKLVKGTSVYPVALKRHRLYVRDANKNDLGYLSFVDDRLSFVLIPLLEQRTVQVKMNISDNAICKNRGGKKYTNVDLWVKVNTRQVRTGIDNVNLKISDILNKYERG